MIIENVILKTNYPKTVFHHVWYQKQGGKQHKNEMGITYLVS